MQVAGRTNDSAGDGTTTASVLAREMIHFGLQVGEGGVRWVLVRDGANTNTLERTCSPMHTHTFTLKLTYINTHTHPNAHVRAQVVTAGANPISVKKGIDKTCDYLVSKLKEHAKAVKGRSDIKVCVCAHAGPKTVMWCHTVVL